MRLSKFTLFFSAYIVISSYFMQDVWTVWKNIFGVNLIILFFVFLCLIAISAVLYQTIKIEFKLKKIILTCLICASGFIFALRQPYLPEKAHVLEFGLLGWLAMRDLKRNRLKALLFVAIIGFLEEGFQKFLPWRVFEVRDILTDTLSGLLGIILYRLTQTRLSAFIRPL